MNPLPEATIFIVEDDPELCQLLAYRARSAGWRSAMYTSAEDFLNEFSDDRPGCVLLDLWLGKSSGLDVLHALQQRGSETPVIIISGHATVSIAVSAFKDHVVDLFEKPFSIDAVLVSVRRAVEQDTVRRAAVEKRQQVLASLTVREREVLNLLLEGQNTQQISRRLEIRPSTVEKHRLKVLEKAGVDSVVQLIRKLAELNKGWQGPLRVFVSMWAGYVIC